MDDGHDLVVRTIREHAPALLRTARRHSLCADDAHDAYQRALEIFLKRAPTLEAATVDRWLHVVVKREAQAVRRARLELVGTEEEALDAAVGADEDGAEERAVRWDRLSRSAEALQRLKPQELTALWLKASGLSYAEIADRQGWTYTKVNRCVTEGRRAFLTRYAGIETGEECERWAPVVAALVDGEATAEQLAAARPHLRRCAPCRATVRELRLAGPGLAGVLPAAPLVGAAAASGSGRWEGALRVIESAWAGVQERAGLLAVKLQGGVEAVSGAKLAAVASAAVVAGGGGAVAVHEANRPAHRASGRMQAATPASRPAAAKVALVTPARSAPAPTRPRSAPAPAPATRPKRRIRAGATEFRRAGVQAHEFHAESSRTVREFRAAAASSPAPVATSAATAPPTSEFRAPSVPPAATSAPAAGSGVVEPGAGGEFGGG